MLYQDALGYCSNKGDNYSGGVFVESAFFRDKPVGVLCEVYGGVPGFNFSFDIWEFGIGRNIVDKEFGLVPIDMGVYWVEGIDFSREHWQVRCICSCWGCGVSHKY
jgi:hypothetical protein